MSLGIVSCGDDYSSVIPDSPVNLKCDLGRAENVSLKETGNNKSFIEPKTNQDYLGYGGILIVHSWTPMDASQPYTAYDLSCPVEISRTTQVVPTEDGWFAVCPVCHSKFDIGSGMGNPLSGPAYIAKKPLGLRIYTVYQEGSILYVRNRY